jgi:hypothetical protein
LARVASLVATLCVARTRAAGAPFDAWTARCRTLRDAHDRIVQRECRRLLTEAGRDPSSPCEPSEPETPRPEGDESCDVPFTGETFDEFEARCASQ